MATESPTHQLPIAQRAPPGPYTQQANASSIASDFAEREPHPDEKKRHNELS